MQSRKRDSYLSNLELYIKILMFLRFLIRGIPQGKEFLVKGKKKLSVGKVTHEHEQGRGKTLCAINHFVEDLTTFSCEA